MVIRLLVYQEILKALHQVQILSLQQLKIKNILFGIELHNTLHHEDFTPFLINANAYG